MHANAGPFCENLRQAVIDNSSCFRQVVATYKSKMQLVIYLLKPNESIHREEHPFKVQFIYVESGSGIVVVGPHAGRDTKKSPVDQTFEVSPGVCVIIPKKTYHYVHNDGKSDLKMFSIYSPDEFEPGRTDQINEED